MLEKCYSKWKIKQGEDKSVGVGFKKEKLCEPNEDLTLTLAGMKINFKSCVKYVGYRLQLNLKQEHVCHNIIKTTITLTTLFPVIKVNDGIFSKVKTQVYVSIILVLIYGIPVCHNAPKYFLRKIKLFEIRCLKLKIDFSGPRVNFKFQRCTPRQENHFMYKISLQFQRKWIS